MSQRIIGGDLRGKKLAKLHGGAIRPTGDRQRESIFNILSNRVAGASVLDLYAGTGAFGIEALSRGAEICVFIDHEKTAVSIIERNIRRCRLENRSRIIRWNIEKSLECLKSVPYAFDLVFMDPPYNQGLIAPTLGHLGNSGSLSGDAILLVEHSFQEKMPETVEGFTRYDQRRYGKTLVSFLRYMVD